MRILKKILPVLVIGVFCLLSGCNKSGGLLGNVSRVRSNIFKGQSDSYEVTLYPETRESPLIADGNIGDSEKIVIVKLRVKNGNKGNFKVCFTLDKEYTLDFMFSAYSDCYVSKTQVESLPISGLTAKIYHNDTVEEVPLNTVLNTDTISYEKALDLVYNSKKEYIQAHSQNKTFNGEIYVRLIEQGGKNFWYVGLITSEQTLALLIDGKAQKIIAEKVVLNN